MDAGTLSGITPTAKLVDPGTASQYHLPLDIDIVPSIVFQVEPEVTFKLPSAKVLVPDGLTRGFKVAKLFVGVSII
jgi:hypothetical protein